MADEKSALPRTAGYLYPTQVFRSLAKCIDKSQIKAATRLSALTKNQVKIYTIDRMLRSEPISFPSVNFRKLAIVLNDLRQKDAVFRQNWDQDENIPRSSIDWEKLGSKSPPELTKQATLPKLFEQPVSDFVKRAELRSIASIPRKFKHWRLLLVGNSGCGKTQLARKLASDLQRKFPDGIIELDCSKFLTPAFKLETVRSLFKEFLPDVKVSELPLEKLCRAFRERLSGRKVLFIFDAVLDEGDVSEIYPGAPSSAIATSRKQLVIPGFQSFRVTPMHYSDAMEMAANILGRENFGSDTHLKICRFAGFNPFVLRGVADEVAKHTSRTHTEILKEIDNCKPGRFDKSKLVRERYEALKPEEQRAWQSFSVFPVHFSRENVKEVLSTLFTGEKLDEIFEALETTCRISPFEVIHGYTQRRPPSSQLDPGSHGRFMLEPFEQLFLAQKLSDSGESEAIQRHHSFYFREQYLIWNHLRAIPSRQHSMDRQMQMDSENIRAAFAWAVRRKYDELERERFEAYLINRQILNHINSFRELKRTITLAELLAVDSEDSEDIAIYVGMHIDDLS